MAIRAGAMIDAGDFADTGWEEIPAASGFGSSLEGRLIGNRVSIRGILTANTNWGSADSLQNPVSTGGIPSELRPPSSLVFLCATTGGTAGTAFRVAILTNGGIQVRCGAGSHTGGVYVNVDYLAD